MDQTTSKIGTILAPNDNHRDAIHIAVAPVTAAVGLYPGDRVGLDRNGHATTVDDDMTGPIVGIADPFLVRDGIKVRVKPGERFYLFLFPGTITSLRHTWTHPEFQRLAAAQREAISHGG